MAAVDELPHVTEDHSLQSVDAKGEPNIEMSVLATFTAALKPFVTGTRAPLVVLVHTDANHVDPDTKAISGFAAALKEHVVLTSANPFVTRAFGSGILMKKVTSAVDDAAFVRTLEQAKRDDSVPALPPGVHVFLTRHKHDFETDHYVVVTGNSQKVASELVNSFDTKKQTLGELYDAGDFERVQAKSAKVRSNVLHAWADHFGIKVESKQTLGQVTHDVVLNDALSEEPAGSTDTAKRVFAVYNGVLDPSVSSGGTLVFHGPFDSYSWYRGPEHQIYGFPSRAFSNPTAQRPFSAVPAHSGHYSEEMGRKPGRHARSTPKLAEHADKRMLWKGYISSYNPGKFAVYNGHDAHWAHIEQSFGHFPGSDVSKDTLEIVAAQLPAFDMSEFSLAQLQQHLGSVNEERVPVKVSGDIVASLQRQWLSVKTALPADTTLSHELRDERGDYVYLHRDTVSAIHAAESGTLIARPQTPVAPRRTTSRIRSTKRESSRTPAASSASISSTIPSTIPSRNRHSKVRKEQSASEEDETDEKDE